MQTQTIRNMIAKAIEHEANTGTVASLITQFAQSQGVTLAPNDVNELLKFIQEYIEHAPACLESVATAAQAAGVADQVIPILEVAEQYFLAPMDIIPDHLGMVGLVDDAYLTHCLLQTLSDNYHAQTGGQLLQMDLTKANLFIRNLLGEPNASLLDAGVATTLNGPAIQQAIYSLSTLATPFSMNEPDPIWGNASIDEIVDTRLGAMGVI